MEQLKIVIKTHFELLIMTGCVMLVIGVFFFTETNYGMGIFGKTGTIFSPLVEDDKLKNEGVGHLQGYVSSYIPIVHYNAGALHEGDCVEFKNLMTVELEDGTLVRGNTEKGFAIYLLDIQTQTGNSVLEKISMDELANMEEVPNTFIYDKELDMLYIFGIGIFTVQVKIYSESGGSQIYEFKLPVELS